MASRSSPGHRLGDVSIDVLHVPPRARGCRSPRTGLLSGFELGAEPSERLQPFPEALGREIEERPCLCWQRPAARVKQVHWMRINLETRKTDPQRSVAQGIGTLVVEHASRTNTFRCGPHGRLGRGDGEARMDRYVASALGAL